MCKEYLERYGHWNGQLGPEEEYQKGGDGLEEEAWAYLSGRASEIPAWGIVRCGREFRSPNGTLFKSLP